MPPSTLARLRKLCLALPEAHEVEAWGEPTDAYRLVAPKRLAALLDKE